MILKYKRGLGRVFLGKIYSLLNTSGFVKVNPNNIIYINAKQLIAEN
tara:strand:- start:80 stop:220 length:141 start_codon:yes stop_codon:yes gene_type:complete